MKQKYIKSIQKVILENSKVKCAELTCFKNAKFILYFTPKNPITLCKTHAQILSNNLGKRDKTKTIQTEVKKWQKTK